MQAIGIVSIALFLVTGAVVGTRLLLLAHRTRRAPELCAGLGLLCLAVLAHPFSAAARVPGVAGTRLGEALFAVGMATTALGITLLYAFTWRTFRPTRAWAASLVVLAGAATAAQSAGLFAATTGLTSPEEILPRSRPWAVGITLTLAGAFAWTAVEGAILHARLRRRRALGLAEPEVVDRVRLWALSGVSTGLLLVGIAALAARGGTLVLHDPVALVFTAVSGLATAVLWTLAFLPPAAYLRRVRRRARA